MCCLPKLNTPKHCPKWVNNKLIPNHISPTQKQGFNIQGCMWAPTDYITAPVLAYKITALLVSSSIVLKCVVNQVKSVLPAYAFSCSILTIKFGIIYTACKLVFLKTVFSFHLHEKVFAWELTNIICHKIWRKALSTMAHWCVIVCISSKHQHGSTHYHSSVQIAEKSTIFKNRPSEMKTHTHFFKKLTTTWQR